MCYGNRASTVDACSTGEQSNLGYEETFGKITTAQLLIFEMWLAVSLYVQSPRVRIEHHLVGIDMVALADTIPSYQKKTSVTKTDKQSRTRLGKD